MSWKCQNCNTLIEDQEFEVCWNCNAEKGSEKLNPQKSTTPFCLRCDKKLAFIGTKNFHEGTRWGALGSLGELFVTKESLDMFACKSCGKVELFIAGFYKANDLG
jgi:hypothetical protein